MPPLDTATLKLAFDIVQTVILAVISIYVWIVTNHKVNAKKIHELEAKHNEELDSIKNRMTAIETEIKHLPDKRSIANIHFRLNEQGEILHKISGELKGIGDNNATILQTLIQQRST